MPRGWSTQRGIAAQRRERKKPKPPEPPPHPPQPPPPPPAPEPSEPDPTILPVGVTTETIWTCDLPGCTATARTDAERQGWVCTTGVEIVGGPSFIAPPPRKYVFHSVDHAIQALQTQLLAAGAGR